jgi:hypothetical protein
MLPQFTPALGTAYIAPVFKPRLPLDTKPSLDEPVVSFLEFILQ